VGKLITLFIVKMFDDSKIIEKFRPVPKIKVMRSLCNQLCWNCTFRWNASGRQRDGMGLVI